MMRKIVIALLLMAAVSGFSQDRKWEHNIYVAGGLLIDREWGESETGVSMKLGYGLNYYFSEHWSLMPGIDIRRDAENFFSSAKDGADSDDFVFLDVPVLAQYHVDRWTFGLGPVFSFCVSNDTYYVDHDPNSELNGKNKIKDFYLGLQPSVKYRIGKHFLVGIDGQIGLHDVRKSYGFETQTTNKYLHNIVATIGVVF
ncbi:MAG: PorT family protein [Prevotella sp.]|nr:PorT family protein [Prevotella sp.]